MSLLFVVPLLTFNHISNIVLNHDNLTLADKHTHSLSHTHAQLLTLILALSLTAERLMTLGGGTGESSRYNMLDEIQAFSIPRACWNTICIFIFSGFVWSHRRRQKGGGPAEAHDAVARVGVRRLLYFTNHALRFLFIQIYLCLCQCLRLGYLDIGGFGGAEYICNQASVTARLFMLLTFILLACAPLTLTNTARARKQKRYLLYAHCWLLTNSTLYWEDLALWCCGSLLPKMDQQMSHNSKHKAPLTSIYDDCFLSWTRWQGGYSYKSAKVDAPVVDKTCGSAL